MTNEEAPLIVVALMVKNEASSIQETLASLIQGGIKHYFVLDTGSTDNTMQLMQDFFDQHHLVGFIQQEPFIDFASSRNRTLELAERYFSTAIFFIMPDAEWHLQHGTSLLAFCEKEKEALTPLYLLTIKMNSIEFTTARLFRASAQIRFEGVVHESPTTVAALKVPDPIHFLVQSTAKGIEKSKQRWEQDLVLLLKAYDGHPQDPRTVFYLAQTYECLGRMNEAYQFYQHRASLIGWDEENFITLFRLGCLADHLYKTQEDKNVNWETAQHYFLQAFSLRPHRIEPLVKIAEHYWPDNAPACYLYIKHAYDKAYPKDDLLFIEKNMYVYERYEIMSRCAWYVGDYILGEEATLRALAVHPDLPHLQRNLSLYQEKLQYSLL